MASFDFIPIRKLKDTCRSLNPSIIKHTIGMFYCKLSKDPLGVHIPADAEHRFRSIPNSDSGACRTILSGAG